jgi:hypothetical protein
MRAQRWRRWLVIPVAAGVLLLATACGPKVSDENCETQKNGDAKYTFTIENTEDDTKVTFHWIVTDDPTTYIDDFNRHGEEITLGASDTTTKTVTVKKGDKDGKRIQLFWPGPKGDDTFKYNKVKKAPC